MAGHMEIGDAEQIQQQRMKAMEEARAAKRRDAFPYPCPTCYAGIGEPCMTRNGGRSVRHKSRLPRRL